MRFCARWLRALAPCLALFASSFSGLAEAQATGRPALAVLIVIDGLPMRQITSLRDQLLPDGFRRFLDQGTWFAEAHYSHALTHTAPGHATIVTGAHPRTHGIIANEWNHPGTGIAEYCTGDTAHTYLGHATRSTDGTSPKNLRAETVGDVLMRGSASSKVLAISGKDRGAILPAGKRGTAYMYMGSSGRFASTTYYMKAHPAWVDAFNNARPADAYLGREWRPLLPDAAYAGSSPDGQVWYGTFGGGRLPVRYGGAQADSAFYSSLLVGPFADELTLAFARAAITGEKLGGRGVTDLLAVSLSGHDYVNHSFSAESRHSHDHLLHLDRMLAAFFSHLDSTVGTNRYVAVLTADHGFTPAPEWSRANQRDGGRIDPRGLLQRIDAGLVSRFGAGPWVAGFSANGLLLRRDTPAARNISLDDAAREAARILAAQPGIAAAMARADVASPGVSTAPMASTFAKSLDRERTPDLVYAPKPGWILSSRAAGTTHGAPNPWDTHVPMMFYGPGAIGSGRVDAAADITDLAPTLAQLLGMAAPAGSEGRALRLPPPSK